MKISEIEKNILSNNNSFVFDLDEKKLNISVYLNKKLKPQKMKDGKEAYPLYIKVIFGRETFLLKSRSIDFHLTDNDLAILDKDDTFALSFEVYWVKSIMWDVVRSGFSREKFINVYVLFTTTVKEKFLSVIKDDSIDTSYKLLYFMMHEYSKDVIKNCFLSTILLDKGLSKSEDFNVFLQSYMNDSQSNDILILFEKEQDLFSQQAKKFIQ